VTRKIALILAAIIIPGGLIALFCAWAGPALARTERGRKVIDFSRHHLSAWMAGWSALLGRERIAA
jgi:hypothetical protein